MTNNDLLLKQAERFLNNKCQKVKNNDCDLESLEKELKKLKDEEVRYNKAYGAGVFSLQKLKEYIKPVKEKLFSIEKQITEIKKNNQSPVHNQLPTNEQIEEFAKRSRAVLKILEFKKKREIVLNTIEKVIGTPSHLQVYGRISLKNYEYKTINRNSRST